jgi:hypothetical protein
LIPSLSIKGVFEYPAICPNISQEISRGKLYEISGLGYVAEVGLGES